MARNGTKVENSFVQLPININKMYGETHVIDTCIEVQVSVVRRPLTCGLQQILQICLLSPIKLITIPLDHPTGWDTKSRAHYRHEIYESDTLYQFKRKLIWDDELTKCISYGLFTYSQLPRVPILRLPSLDSIDCVKLMSFWHVLILCGCFLHIPYDS